MICFRDNSFFYNLTYYSIEEKKYIETIQVGDYVTAKNLETGEVEYREVISTSVNESQLLFKLTVAGEVIEATPNHAFYIHEKGWIAAGNGGDIKNDILDLTRKGSALKVDDVKPVYKVDPVTNKQYLVQEFPATAQSHGFNNIIDNYAGHANKTQINNGMLYQLEGSLNGVDGRFEWIVQDGYVTHRMFIQGGTMNGVPIRP